MAQYDTARTVRPFANICEQDGKVLLRLEMPGVGKENLEVSVEGNELRVYGKRSVPEPQGEYVVRERRGADFYQAYTIDETIDRERIDAKLENGVLQLTLNLKESEKPRKIDVKSS